MLAAAAPGHVEHVRRDPVRPAHPGTGRAQLRAISQAILATVGNPPPCEDDEVCSETPAPPSPLASLPPAERLRPATPLNARLPPR